MNSGSKERSADQGQARSAGAARRPSDDERYAYLRSTWILNPGIPHFVDVPFGERR